MYKGDHLTERMQRVDLHCSRASSSPCPFCSAEFNVAHCITSTQGELCKLLWNGVQCKNAYLQEPPPSSGGTVSHLSQSISLADSQGPDPCIRLHCLMLGQLCELAGYCDSAEALAAAASHHSHNAQAWCKRQDH